MGRRGQPIALRAAALSEPLRPTRCGVRCQTEGHALKNFVYGAWAGVFVPRSVPEAAAVKLNKELAEIVKRDDFARFIQDSAALPVESMMLTQAAAFYQGELDKFHRIARAIKLKPQ